MQAQLRVHEKTCPEKLKVAVASGPEIPCPKCGTKFKSAKWLENHEKNCVQMMDCSICGKTYNRGAQTLATLKKMVRDHEKVCANKTEEERHKIKKCGHCGKEFSTIYNMRRHVANCSQRPDNQKNKSDDEDGDYVPKHSYNWLDGI